MFYLFTAFFLTVMNVASIKILLPEIMSDLSVELNWLTWVVNAYTLPLAALIPIAGRLGDTYGPRRFFLAGISVLGLGAFICGFSSTLAWLIAGRVIQALGGAFLVPNSLSILLSGVSGNQRGRVLGIWGSIGASGAVMGPVIAGFLTDIFSWRGSFMVVSVLALCIVLLSAKKILSGLSKETNRENTEKKKFDILGAFLMISAIATLLLGITLLPDLGWQNRTIQLLLITAVTFLFAFIKIEGRASNPLLDPSLLRKPRFSLGLLVGFIEQFVVAGTMLVMPIYFYSVLGYNAANTALMLTPPAIAVALFSPVFGRLSDRIGPGPLISAGMVFRALSFLILAQITITTGYPFIAAALALNGLGFSMTSTPALNSALSAVGSGQHGVASGVHNMVRFTGASAGTTIGGIVLYAYLPLSFSNISGPISGFYQALLMSALVCLPGLAAGIYLVYHRFTRGTGEDTSSCLVAGKPVK